MKSERLLSVERGEAIVDLFAQRGRGRLLENLAEQLLRLLAVALLLEEPRLVVEATVAIEAARSGVVGQLAERGDRLIDLPGHLLRVGEALDGEEAQPTVEATAVDELLIDRRRLAGAAERQEV